MAVLNHADTIFIMGVISGVINTAMVKAMGGDDNEQIKAFWKGFTVGTLIGTLTCFVAYVTTISIIQAGAIVGVGYSGYDIAVDLFVKHDYEGAAAKIPFLILDVLVLKRSFTVNTLLPGYDGHKESITEGGSGYSDNVYDGVRQASKYLKEQGVPRQHRKKILESFDVRTIKLEKAGENTYGLRFYGGNANAEGRYLFETFSPLTNRENLVLPYEWNSMTGIQQFQVKNGTTIIAGKAAPQTGFGAQYIGGAIQWYIINLEDLIKCH